MIPVWLVITICLLYLGILFFIAYYGDKKAQTKSVISTPVIYALSLTTYCTAWTFYGSVGKASTTGIGFLATYLGPVLLCPLWVILFKRIIRICKRDKISSISDFIATRYGKAQFLGNLITILTFIFIIPYISIQLRAISSSFDILIDNTEPNALNTTTAFFLVVIMSFFIILFGTRNASASERNEGMVSVIAFEAVFKLFAFLIVGFYITYFVFDGFGDLFTRASEKNLLNNLNNIKNTMEGGYWDWFMLILLSFLVFTILPRQFHLIAIENTDEKHVNKASWIFPLYLFLITLFVIPIAIAGMIYFGDTNTNADSYVLMFPMNTGNNILATLVFLGGMAAATGMIIVETIAISTMLSKNILIPFIIKNKIQYRASNVQKTLLFYRKVSIPLVLFTAYFYMILIGDDYPLVEVGLISFVGIVQLAPSFFGGLFWKKGNRFGTMAGIAIGSLFWFYTLLYPTLVRSGFVGDISFVEFGPFEISWLRPYALFGLEGFNKISHGFFWSILFNISFYVSASIFTVRTGIEIQQANRFITPKLNFDHQRFRNKFEEVHFNQLRELLIIFMGPERTKKMVSNYFIKFDKKYEQNDIVDIHFVDYAENSLSDEIGNISARIVFSKLLKEEELSRNEIMSILEETKEAKNYSKELTIKSDKLRQIQKELMLSNDKLKEIDLMKDEFILTISHELRTPITSIKLLSEMLYNQPEEFEQQKQEFLKTIVDQSTRLSALIDDTLLQEKLHLGKLDWEFLPYPANEIIASVLESIRPIAKEEKIDIIFNPYDGSKEIKADRIHLERVFINVIMNAIKFKDPEKEENTIDVAIFENDGFDIQITDNGIGIHKKNTDKIFEAFVQVNGQKKGTKPKGSGLGLSIARKIVEKHDGTITAESVLGSYTKIKITLPAISIHETT